MVDKSGGILQGSLRDIINLSLDSAVCPEGVCGNIEGVCGNIVLEKTIAGAIRSLQLPLGIKSIVSGQSKPYKPACRNWAK